MFVRDRFSVDEMEIGERGKESGRLAAGQTRYSTGKLCNQPDRPPAVVDVGYGFPQGALSLRKRWEARQYAANYLLVRIEKVFELFW